MGEIQPVAIDTYEVRRLRARVHKLEAALKDMLALNDQMLLSIEAAMRALNGHELLGPGKIARARNTLTARAKHTLTPPASGKGRDGEGCHE